MGNKNCVCGLIKIRDMAYSMYNQVMEDRRTRAKKKALVVAMARDTDFNRVHLI